MNFGGRDNKTPTIQDVAAAVGLHISTVSLALSGKGTLSAATRQKVLETARALGYRPNPMAQRLAARVSSNLVCIVSSPLDIGLGTQKLLQIQKALVARSLEVPLYTYDGPTTAADKGERPEESYVTQIRQICQQRPRAIVCAGPVIHPVVLPELEAYQSDGGIVISYDLPTPLQCDQVIFDREDNAYRAARVLLERGHRHLGIVMSAPSSWSPEIRHLPWISRLEGFRRALDEFDTPLREEWLFFPKIGYEVGGQEIARQFLALPERPTGLCIVNDYMAMAFMVTVQRAGVRVPEDISIVGHDNQTVAALCPVPLTAMSHPAEHISQTVVQMLIERIEGFDGPPRITVLTGDLVLRESVTAPPDG